MNQPRALKPGMRGADVWATKRALRKWAVANHHPTGIMWPVHNGYYGKSTISTVDAFQKYHAIKKESGIGPKTFEGLEPYYDKFGQVTLAAYARAHPALSRRDRLVGELQWGIMNSAIIGYAEVRPIPIHSWKDHKPLTTDCSGSYTCACYAAGLPDPNGLGYDGQGNTETLVDHMREITRAEAQPGDAALFGRPTVHVAAFLQPGASVDPQMFNHGRTGSPDEPLAEPLSGLLDAFAGMEVRYRSPL